MNWPLFWTTIRITTNTAVLLGVFYETGPWTGAALAMVWVWFEMICAYLRS